MTKFPKDSGTRTSETPPRDYVHKNRSFTMKKCVVIAKRNTLCRKKTRKAFFTRRKIIRSVIWSHLWPFTRINVWGTHMHTDRWVCYQYLHFFKNHYVIVTKFQKILERARVRRRLQITYTKTEVEACCEKECAVHKKTQKALSREKKNMRSTSWSHLRSLTRSRITVARSVQTWARMIHTSSPSMPRHYPKHMFPFEFDWILYLLCLGHTFLLCFASILRGNAPDSGFKKKKNSEPWAREGALTYHDCVQRGLPPSSPAQHAFHDGPAVFLDICFLWLWILYLLRHVAIQ